MEDVLVWLKLIELDEYAQNFTSMKIDGLIILDLEESDLEVELKITVKLHKKKMTKAIELLKEYHKLYKEGLIQSLCEGNTLKTDTQMIGELGKTKTILLSTHVLPEVEAMASRVILVNNGRVVLDGTLKDLGGASGDLEARFRELTTKPVALRA